MTHKFSFKTSNSAALKIAVLLLLFLFIAASSCSNEQENAEKTETPAETDKKASRDKLLQYLELKIKQDPDNPDKYIELAKASIQRARYTGDVGYYLRAEKALEKSIELSPDSYEANLLTGIVRQVKHRFRESIDFLQKAIESDPESSFAYGVLGDAYLHTGSTEKAGKMYEKMHGIDPSLESYSRLSNLESTKENHDSAIRYMKLAYEEGVKSSGAPEDLAWTQAMTGSLYFEKGDLETAESYYNMSLETAPDYYLALQKLAELHYKKGNYRKAEELYKKVLEINERPEVCLALGELYEKTGDSTLSEKYYRKAENIKQKYKKLGFEAFHTDHSHTHHSHPH